MKRYNLFLVCMMLVACGGQGTNSFTPPQTTPKPKVNPTQPPNNGSADTRLGEEIKQGLKNRIQKSNGFSAEAQFFTQGYFFQGKPVSDLRKSSSRYKLEWRKPEKLSINILDTNMDILKGGSLKTDDGKTLYIRASGLLSLFAIPVNADSDYLKNNRNHTFNQTQPKAQINRLTSNQARWELQNQNGTKITFKITGLTPMDPDIDREVLVIDSKSYHLYKMTVYQGTELLQNSIYLRFNWL
jgi:hypothetical protein